MVAHGIEFEWIEEVPKAHESSLLYLWALSEAGRLIKRVASAANMFFNTRSFCVPHMRHKGNMSVVCLRITLI